jgi:hypothetical protein
MENKMKNIIRRNQSMNRQTTSPMRVPRSLRGHEISTLTSLPAGRVVPVAAMPLLREDAVRRGRMRLSFEMHETAEILMNAVHCNVKAYFVPFLAFDRFQGMDDLNRSYAGEPPREGDPVIPFFETEVRGAVGTNPILEYLGLHAQSTDEINTAYVEAYNQIWNYRATRRSLNIEHRARLDKTLAPAFWQHDRYKHIVPDFDQAMIDGEVALNVADAKLPVRGIGKYTTTFYHAATNVRESGKKIATYDSYSLVDGSDVNNHFYVQADPEDESFPNIFAELAENGITVSLSNIDAAKKTAAFAKLREQYNGHDDEYIIDMLMNGLRVPEQAYRQPILLASQKTIFGLSKRYAADGANLTESVVNGATYVDLTVRMPRVETGGIVMVVAECVPDQLFERQQDPLLFTTAVEQLPSYLRDELDNEKVDTVYNAYVDVDHDTPEAVFGYEPLNAKWDVKARRVGGRFLRPEVDASFDEDRQRIWSSEVQNPTLSEDFYLASEIHTKPFADQTQDPFEVVASGQLVIEGNTVFGPALIEASDNYEQVLAEKPTETIEK